MRSKYYEYSARRGEKTGRKGPLIEECSFTYPVCMPVREKQERELPHAHQGIVRVVLAVEDC
jgi:hypothetical protein